MSVIVRAAGDRFGALGEQFTNRPVIGSAIVKSVSFLKKHDRLAVGLFTLIVTYLLSGGKSTPYNNYVLLADAFNHGHIAINWPGPSIDALLYQEHRYVIEAPLPAVLLMPFVAIWGTTINQTWMAVLLCAVAMGAAWELFKRLGVDTVKNAWLCLFALVGTSLLWCAMLGDVWFIAHVSAVCFTLLALVELVGKRRGWLVALFATCAFESRFTMILAVPVYAYLLATEADRPLRLSPQAKARLGGFVGVLAVVGVVYLAYNRARWGTWTDIGYTEWFHQDEAGLPTGAPFQLHFLQHQLYSFFIQGPTFGPGYPWVRPELTGVALEWTSPALVLAVLARRPTRLVVAMWAAVIPIAVVNLVYYVNGFSQFSMRHALDFIPFLLVLIAIGIREKMPRWGYWLIAYSVAVGLWGCWYWNDFVRT